MTNEHLTEALAKLHAAGKIRSPWSPGMLVPWPTRPDGIESLRILVGDPTEIVASEAHVPFRCRWSLRNDGWRAAVWDDDGGWEAIPVTKYPTPRVWALDLGDPATVGCLTALLREALGDPYVRVVGHEEDENGEEWHVRRPMRYGTSLLAEGPSPGEAVAAALIALAGKCW